MGWVVCIFEDQDCETEIVGTEQTSIIGEQLIGKAVNTRVCVQ